LKNHDKMLGFRGMLMYLSIIIVLHCFIKKKKKNIHSFDHKPKHLNIILL